MSPRADISNQVFVSRYQLYLPQREQLEAEFKRFMESADNQERLKNELVRLRMTNSDSPYGEQTSTTS